MAAMTPETQAWHSMDAINLAMRDKGLPAFFDTIKNRSCVAMLPRDVQQRVLDRFENEMLKPRLAGASTGGAVVSAAPPDSWVNELERTLASGLDKYAKEAFWGGDRQALAAGAPRR